MNQLPPRLTELVQDFEECVGQEKLEYLLYLSARFTELPKFPEDRAMPGELVNECMTPVYILAESKDGQLTYYFDVPAESPTVRGFATLLGLGLNDLPAQTILTVPGEFYLKTGLQNVLSTQRLNGLSAILAYMKRLAAEHLQDADHKPH